MSLICSLRNLCVSYGNKVLFDFAQLSISRGDKIGLLGQNGKGKSTLFKILADQVQADESSPSFIFDKKKGELDGFSVFLVPQEMTIEGDLLVKDVLNNFYPLFKQFQIDLDQINSEIEKATETEFENLINKQKEILENFDKNSGPEILRNFESYLKYFGITNLNLNVRTMSGGEQKKILLALGFSSPANIILWDEPTNHLDLKTIKLFEENLKSACPTYLIISHDRHLLAKVTNNISYIEHGKIEKFEKGYLDFIEYQAHKEKERVALLTKLKNSMRRETAWMNQGIKARGTRSKKRVENYEQIKKTIQDVKGKAKKSFSLNLFQGGKKSKSLVEGRELSFSYGKNELLKNLNFQIHRGDKIGLLGDNGTGKSTLIKMITQEIFPQSGNLKHSDDLKVQYFDQKREELEDDITPFEFLSEGSDFVILPNGREKHISAYFESFLFSRDELHRPLKTFSGGEKNRLQLAKNLLKTADLWVFDEPTNDLDLETLEILERELVEYKGGLIIISHDRSFLANITNSTWIIYKGDLLSFEVGLETAQDYLEAILLEESEETEEVVEKLPEKKKKLSNYEKERLKKLPQMIESLEGEISKIEEDISKFDFNSMSPDKTKEYEDLSRDLKAKENNLLDLYEDLERLENF